MSVIAHLGAIRQDEEHPSPAWIPAGQKRRLDPVTWLCCLAVDRWLPTADWRPDPACAVVGATALGSLVSTQRFADSLRTYGDAAGSPSPFTTSVHNATVGTMAELLGLSGPGFTVSQGGTSCLAALRLAVDLLREQRCPEVLLVVGDVVPAWLLPAVTACAPPGVTLCGCAAALHLVPAGTGRPVLDVPPANAVRLTHGAVGDDPAAGRSTQEVLGFWSPTALFAALAASDDALPLILEERSGDDHLRQALGARCE